MQNNFISCAGFTLRAEGGLCNVAGDAGGLTNFGISQAAYPHLDIAGLTDIDAVQIYRTDYWAKVNGDGLPLGIDLAVFDMAVNAGPETAAKRLQGLVGAVQDGNIGPRTLAAVTAKGGPNSLIALFTYSRIDYYRGLSNYAEFGAGWEKRANVCQTMALAMVG